MLGIAKGKVFPALWILLFVLVEYVFSASFSPWTLYGFEVFFVGLSILCFRGLTLKFTVSRTTALSGVVALGFGFLVFFFAKMSGILVPINVHDGLTTILLLVYAPIFEELIFRFGVWKASKSLIGNDMAGFVTSSVLFSFSHFYSYFFVSADFRPFILYQTVYTLILAIFLGGMLIRTRSLGVTVGLHFLFNFGFFIGAFNML